MADPVRGSAQRVEIPEDTNSAVVQELVAQLNKAGVQSFELISESLGAGGTARAFLGAWGQDVFIRDILIGNAQNNALAQAGTRIRFRKAPLTELDLVAGPGSVLEVLDLNGFNTGNFPAKTGVWSKNITDGATGQTNVKTGSGYGFKVKSTEFLYVEFTNSEAAARALMIVLDIAATDFLQLGPRGTQDTPRRVQRDFNRSYRRSGDQ